MSMAIKPTHNTNPSTRKNKLKHANTKNKKNTET